MPAGLAPANADVVNNNVGLILRAFVDNKESVGHMRDSLAGIDLKIDPYNMSAADETIIKTAVNELDTALDAIDMTFINQLTGLW